MRDRILRNALFLPALLLVLLLPLVSCICGTTPAFADKGEKICFDGDSDYDWAHFYNVDGLDGTLTLEQLNITVLDKNGVPLSADKYDLNIFYTYYDDDRGGDVEEAVTSPFGVIDRHHEGFTEYIARASIKEGGKTRIVEGTFFILDKYSINYVCGDISFKGFTKNEGWRMHARYWVKFGSSVTPIVKHKGIARVLTKGADYSVTFYKRSGLLEDMNNFKKGFEDILVASNKMKVTENGGVPSSPGYYFARFKGKSPYYGQADVLLDIYDTATAPSTGKTLAYNGKLQSGVTTGKGYVLSGATSAKKAGSYTAKATLKDGYIWPDGTTDPKIIKWKIVKAANPLAIKGKTAVVKYGNLVKKNQVLSMTRLINFVKKGQGKIACAKASGNKMIVYNKASQKVIVKKGLKKGAHLVKFKVKAAGNANVKPSAVKTVTCKIVVK